MKHNQIDFIDYPRQGKLITMDLDEIILEFWYRNFDLLWVDFIKRH